MDLFRVVYRLNGSLNCVRFISQIFLELFACMKFTFDGKLTSDAGRFLKPILFNNLMLFTDN